MPLPITATSLSLGPPAAPTAREPHLNGSATPDSNGDRRGQPDAAINGRQSSYIHQVKDTVPESTPEHREALSRSPLAEHQNTMSTTIRNKHARSVDYILPSRKTADGLMETYWETAHALFPIIDIDAFNRAYQSIWSGTPIENESQIMCTLNVIFALASSFSDSMEVKARVQSADVFFDRAQELFEMDLWNASGQSLESVQCLLLICQFLQSRSASRQAWVFIGLAVSTAESLFLHMTTDRVLTERQKITHQVVWHGCLYMKRILAMHDKRPSMIDALAVTMVSKPFTRNQHAVRSEELYFYHTLALSEILDEILLQTHKSRNMPDNPADLIHESVLSSITTLDGQLSRWRAELPPQFHQVTFTQAPPRTPIHRQANSIRLQYYNARILLFRPILISWCRLQAGSLQAPGYAESFQAHTSSTCSTLCLHSSLDMIEFIYTRLPPFEPNGPPPAPTQQPPIDPSNPSATAASPSHSQSSPPLSPLPAWWDVITYLHTSALIILLSRLNRTLCMSVPPTTIEGAFKTSLDCLRQFARLGGSALAERSIRYLESLATKTDIARMDLEVSREIQEQGRFRPGVGGGRLSDLEVGVRGLEWVEVGVYEL
ncbi:putative c6 transcription factor [Phaeomoniella chlamydospora]|uniref:Putative c6 transcription factor n=1 Tax=Phaeomoniella chlamydospora TaxID=158046 RepID=A0A0G2EU37_PHACM|nr:putative c6 transcription factor [Phaeomoniella chlamydospora]